MRNLPTTAVLLLAAVAPRTAETDERAVPLTAVVSHAPVPPNNGTPERPAEPPAVTRVEPAVAPIPVAVRHPAEAAFDAKFREIFDEMRLPNGLVLDRRSDRNTVSCAATGFHAYASALMARRGTASRGEVGEALRGGFRTTLAATPARNRGWLYHFTDAEGRPKAWSEVSTVDSAIFYLGFLQAAEALGDADFLAEVRAAVDRVDQDFVLRDGYFLHGLHWAGDEPRFLPYVWDDNSEGVMIYRLFGRPFVPRVVRHDYPLFVYYYPLCFFDEPTYRDHLREAVAYQVRQYGYTGVTAADGPTGYTASDTGLISPLTLFALSNLFPEARATLAEYDVDAMVPSYHVHSGWAAADKVMIDYASAYVLMVRPQPQPAAPTASAAGAEVR